MELDTAQCYQALLAHDARFDGVFFVGVSTTRIYCRTVCTARTPRPDRCPFYPSAAAGEQGPAGEPGGGKPRPDADIPIP